MEYPVHFAKKTMSNMAAFFKNDGGTLFLGIADDGTAPGLGEGEEQTRRGRGTPLHPHRQFHPRPLDARGARLLQDAVGFIVNLTGVDRESDRRLSAQRRPGIESKI